jgi:hypothetical protein
MSLRASRCLVILDYPDRINSEVGSILAECSTARHPLAMLNENYRRLRKDPAWDVAAATEVYQVALRILKRVVPESRHVTDG